MKKYIFVSLSIGVLCLILVSFCMLFFKESYPKKAYLLINDEIYNDNSEIYHGYAMLPMLFVCEKYGATVDWLDDENAEISYNNTILTLSLSEESLIEHTFGNELLTPVPGSSSFHCLVTENDVILDDDTLRVILNYLFNIQTEIYIDYQRCKVSIETIQENNQE